MYSNFILCSFAIAGIAVIWRNWITEHQVVGTWISNKLHGLGNAILCGSCFTYWLSLAVTLSAGPLQFWQMFTHSAINGLFQWMALSFTSVFLRFLYVTIQEVVHYQVHHLKHDHH